MPAEEGTDYRPQDGSGIQARGRRVAHSAYYRLGCGAKAAVCLHVCDWGGFGDCVGDALVNICVKEKYFSQMIYTVYVCESSIVNPDRLNVL